jgi:NADP-reducing hydrogenase subunit HndB
MPKVTIDDLKKIREEAKQSTALRAGNARARVTVHMDTCGISAGAREVMAALLKQIETLGITDVIVTTSGCAGLCSREPMATIQLGDQPPVKYVDLTPEKMERLFQEHVLGGKVIEEFALASGSGV